jgi:saccharopine dehydrogenase (NAD+, L-lysine forming)
MKTLIIIISYTLNRLAEANIASLSQRMNCRVVALVEKNLQEKFSAYQKNFDAIYYLNSQVQHYCFSNFDNASVENVIKAELAINSDLRVLSLFESDVELAAQLTEQFKLPGITKQQAEKFRNKMMMKKLFMQQGLLTAKACVVDFSLACDDIFSQYEDLFNLPFIVKPVALVGSLGVKKISNQQEFKNFYYSHFDTAYMVEEYIVGDLYHFDMHVKEGELSWFGCGIYNCGLMEFGEENIVGSMMLVPADENYCKLKNCALAIVKSPDFADGIYHLEAFITPGDKMIMLEAAARAGGGLIVKCYEEMFGFNLVQALLESSLGLPYSADSKFSAPYIPHFWIYYPEKNRCLEQLSQPELECTYSIKDESNVARSSKEAWIGEFTKVLAYEPNLELAKKEFFTMSNNYKNRRQPMPTLWIRCEVSSKEKRTFLLPEQAKELIRMGFHVVVEKSRVRCVKDQEYALVGCQLVMAGSWKDAPREAFILGVKAVQDDSFPLHHTHLCFAHSYRGQPDAKNLLTRFKRGKGCLLDYEYLINGQGKADLVVNLYPYAGMVGAALAVLKYAYKSKKISDTFENKIQMQSLVRKAYQQMMVKPKIVVIGVGNTGAGAVELLRAAGIRYDVWTSKETANIEKLQTLKSYHIIINCIYTEEKDKPFLIGKDIEDTNCVVSIIADVTCDIGTPQHKFPFYQQTTTMLDERCIDINDNLSVIAIDNLPSLLAIEVSEKISSLLFLNLGELLKAPSIKEAVSWKSCYEKFIEVMANE